MGKCCSKVSIGEEQLNTVDLSLESGNFEEILREDINNEKFVIQLNYNNDSNKIKVLYPEIKLDIIHVDTIDSTMPASEKYIDEGNTSPFIYNTVIQTSGVGKGNRKWAGGIVGNLYTSTGIPLDFIKNELNDDRIIVKITAISIIQQLNKLVKNQYFLKHPNDILCKDKNKLGGIIARKYKDFYIIGFGINIVDKPEQDQIRKEGLLPCYVKAHLPDEVETPNALNLSIDVTKNILFNLNLTSEQIDKLFNQYLIKN